MRKFLYLISPNKIKPSFYLDLEEVLSSNKVMFFQLRLKDYSASKILNIGKKIRKITNKYKVKFLINDSFKLWNSKGRPVDTIEEGVVFNHLESREGLVYLKGATKPYTGKEIRYYRDKRTTCIQRGSKYQFKATDDDESLRTECQ